MYGDDYKQIYGTYRITQDTVDSLDRIGITLHLLPPEQWLKGYYLDNVQLRRYNYRQQIYNYPYGQKRW